MTGERKTFWSAEEIAQIAAEEGIQTCGAPCCHSSLQTAPPGLTRAQVVDALRMMAAIPEDNGDPATR